MNDHILIVVTDGDNDYKYGQMDIAITRMIALITGVKL